MNIIKYFQIALSLGLVILVLLQSKANSVSSSFGGASMYHTKRGAEKFLFILTGVVGTLFVINSLLIIILS